VRHYTAGNLLEGVIVKRLMALIPLLVIGACVTPPAPLAPLRFSGPPSTTAYAAYLAPGTATLKGQAFLTTRGGQVRTAAGREVTLDPATQFSMEWFTQRGTDLGTFLQDPPDTTGLFRRARRMVTADGDGRFEFDSLPPGAYLVRTVVTWDAPDPVWGTLTRQGGVVWKHVDVARGATVAVIVN